MGLGNRPFRLYKVRTMRVARPGEEQRWASKQDSRTTGDRTLASPHPHRRAARSFGTCYAATCRSWGPGPSSPRSRPSSSEEISYFSYRHLVKPGITGWAQIHYGYAGSVEQSRIKLAYDLYYVRHHTLLLDVDVMLRTLFVMMARIGSR